MSPTPPLCIPASAATKWQKKKNIMKMERTDISGSFVL